MTNSQLVLDSKAARHYQQWLDTMQVILADVERVMRGGLPNAAHTKALLSTADEALKRLENSTMLPKSNPRR